MYISGLREFRVKMKMDPTQFAAKVGCNVMMIRMIERGAYKVGTRVLERIAVAWGLDLAEVAKMCGIPVSYKAPKIKAPKAPRRKSAKPAAV